MKNEAAEFSKTRGGRCFLLGLIHGHWKFSIPDVDAVEVDANDPVINTGIAIVVPVHKIMEGINHPKLAEQRAKIMEARKNETLPEMD